MQGVKGHQVQGVKGSPSAGGHQVQGVTKCRG